MTLWNLGSINADNIYTVRHIPAPGETLDALGLRVFIGGKGANMSVAAARAGATVRHIGAVGSDGGWMVERLMEWGVVTTDIATLETPTGHAIIYVDESGENNIVIFPGANREISADAVKQSLTQAKTGDWFITQNEVNGQLEAARLARDMGLNVAYAAAPFDANQTQEMLPFLDFLILNKVEADQLRAATGQGPGDFPVRDVIVTLGGDGAVWFGPDDPVEVPALPVTPVDTTGAGDTFTGYVLAGLDRGQPVLQAMETAGRAGALMVTRNGTADVIPDLAEVRAFSV
ncbi:ribokinase [Thalassorhabdomicrobium marinisediminis]|uniref:Ribokinase n=1 Tax=Thalassorhabdomicrobium marinisediminis TaxID=2170577 RepID=A0A2T7FZT0_9RHOB|nr:ribokinase [Thalassorhabdomicrobium marinisediminis]PVA07670.1 ribokinase [Thalassorhabdomicrobium marinisediminis]